MSSSTDNDTAKNGLPCASAVSPNTLTPHWRQNRCRILRAANWYTDSSSSPQSKVSASAPTGASQARVFAQIEQLHLKLPCSLEKRTRKRTCPQWQLPRYVSFIARLLPRPSRSAANCRTYFPSP